ncbi:unnamed protein product [Adineta steineri]|uniref:RING-type domain-containing protein n=1 Tax=Adineta steineri TaxID=433720 RepID=A0A818WRC0_9BILA|nr:unnamed protein product [Adineta steineri]CAF3729068.1 unnamed protein product [Adineta steineri]
MEEGNIDRDRIVDGHLVDDDFFCPVCQCLLWKPCACSKCRHLFCRKCLYTWLENPNSGRRCPFRCEPFEEQDCSLSIQSRLNCLYIHCRNLEFGCTQTLSYNSLEQHENVDCEYLSKRCSECDQLVLMSRMDEHCEMPGLCVPHPVKCTACQTYIEKLVFKDHFHECFLNRMITLDIQTTMNHEQGASSIWLRTILCGLNAINLLEQQRRFSPVPTDLIGVDAVRQARERRCGFFYHMFMMLTFVLANGFKAPFFILAFSAIGLVQCATVILIMYGFFLVRMRAHIYRGCYVIMLISYILTYGILLLFRFVSDSLIIYLLGLFSFLYGCSNRLISMELFEMHPMFHMTKINIALYCAVLLTIKILLLLCRFYYWYIPIYLTAGITAWINFSIAFHTKPASRHTTT